MSCLWKQFPDKILYQKTFAKKAQNIFFVLGWRSQPFRHLLQNPKLKMIAIFFKVITHCTYTCLSPWALHQILQRNK